MFPLPEHVHESPPRFIKGLLAIVCIGNGTWRNGYKFLCCKAEAKLPDCRWTGCKEDCRSRP